MATRCNIHRRSPAGRAVLDSSDVDDIVRLGVYVNPDTSYGEQAHAPDPRQR